MRHVERLGLRVGITWFQEAFISVENSKIKFKAFNNKEMIELRDDKEMIGVKIKASDCSCYLCVCVLN